MGRLVRGGSQPEDLLFAHMPSTMPKSSKVAIMKSLGMVKQSGRHLVPTAKGMKSINKIKRKG